MKNLFKTRAARADGIRGILSAFDACLPKPVTDFGVERIDGAGSVSEARLKANAEALAVLNSEPDPLLLTDEQKEKLRGYTGRGGIGDSTNEYYTPKVIASAVWDMLASYGFEGGNVLEPSCATGVFNETKLPGAIITGAEVDPTSSQINQLLHPDDTIYNMPFEALAKVTPDGTFDAVVGNAPFGTRMNTFANQDDAYRDMKTNEQYFVMRSIDKVKPGGLVSLIVNTSIVSTKSMRKFRAAVAKKAEFLGAHRFPSGVFGASGSESVVTDVVVFRKHPDDLAERIADLPDSVLKDANVLWDTFLSGNWFKEDGIKFVHGEVLEGAGNWGSDLVVIPGLPKAEDGKRLTADQRIEKANKIDAHNAMMAKNLSKRFDSRIDWALLQSAEPDLPSYTDGDRRTINGRWHEMVDGQWLPVAVLETAGGLDASKYGFNSITALRDALSSPRASITMPFHQLAAIHANLRDTLPFEVQAAFRLADQVGPEHRERIVKGALLGAELQMYNERRMSDRDDDNQITELQLLCKQMYEQFGDSNKVRGIKGLTGDSAASYKFFATALDENGEFRNLVAGDIQNTKILIHDYANAEHVVEKLTSAGFDAQSITLDTFRETYNGPWSELSDSELLNKLAALENVAIDHHGSLMLMDRACSGDIGKAKAGIMQGLANESLSDTARLNLHRQLDMIKRRRKWTDASRINFGMRDQFIPRSLVLEFLHGEGFSDLQYSGVEYRENLETGENELTEIKDYSGDDGFFTGYYTQDGKQKTRKDDDGGSLGAQLEKYLNGLLVRSNDAKENSKYRDKIRDLETRFQSYIRQHDSLDNLVERYNDTYNAFIPFEHSDAPLNLEGVSGEVVHKGYQNSAIRRLSEEGRGILGFGTGLGKTLGALGLAKLNHQTGRSRRIGVVMPKSVSENWINETVMFYGAGNLDKTMFVGFDLVRNGDGSIQTVPILGGDGNQKVNPVTGNAMSNPVLKQSTPEEVISKMHRIPHSDVNLVLMTKEQFARIPLKASTLEDNAYEHLSSHQQKGHVAMLAKGYREQSKKEAVINKFSDDGTEKVQEFPYFEDMNFDLVIVDEAHNYRNSQDAGQVSRSLVYVSAGQEAQVAADMRQKLQYLKRKQNGRGAVLLTATPTPNSPLDIYNMLSHVMTTDEWLRLGIANQDDFIKTFGEVSEVMINRISGGVAHVEGLTGFKNLDALRSIFHRFVNKKSVEDVKEDVKVPTIKDKLSKVQMSAEQKSAYELLRFRAKLISDRANDIDPRQMATPKELILIDQLEAQYPDDQLFSVIRDMDRVCSDIELFKGRMTFVFAKDKAAAAKKIMTGLPETRSKTVTDRNDAGERVKVKVTLNLDLTEKTDSQGSYVAQINQEFEPDVLAALKKHGLSQRDISHPLSPKYAQLVENVRAGLADGGKQLIFSEEKSQHKKLHRILCHHLNLLPGQIGILNGDTVAGTESAINDENAKANRKTDSKALAAQGLDDEALELDGMEAIAAKYNSGEFKILILNKKGEVGINLHIGTSDIHHVTLPWTRDSLVQRNGRGARVGAPQDEVNSHVYVNEGSFDVFRKETIDRKGNWQDDLYFGDAARADNGDAEPDFDVGAILATNVEEYRAQIAEQKRLAQEALKREKAQEAGIALHNFIKSKRLIARDMDKERGTLSRLQAEKDSEKSASEKAYQLASQARELWQTASKQPDVLPEAVSMLRGKYRAAAEAAEKAGSKLRASEKKYAQQNSFIQSIERAKGQSKIMRANVEAAMAEGLIDVTVADLEEATNMAVSNGRVFRAGEFYNYRSNMKGNSDKSVVIRISGFSLDQSMCNAKIVFGSSKNQELHIELRTLGSKTFYSESEIEIKHRLEQASYADTVNIVGRDDFHRHLREKAMSSYMSVVVRTDSGFEKKQLSYVDDNELDTVVYPDRADSKLREEAIKFALANIQQQYSIDGAMSLLLGNDWRDIVAAADPDAPTDDDIAKWLIESASEVDAATTGINYAEVLRRAKENQRPEPSLLKSFYMRKIMELMPKSAHTNRYEKAVRAFVDTQVIRFEADVNGYLQQIRDRNSKMVADALSDDESTIRTRLQGAPRWMPRWSSNFADSWEDLLEKLQGSTYDGIPAVYLADLLSAGYTPYLNPSSTTWAVLDAEVGSSLINMTEQASRYSEKLKTFLAGAVAQAEEVTASTSGVSLDDMGDIPFAAALLAKHGISSKRNTEYCSKKPAYGWIGLHDPQGYGAKLYKTLAGKGNPNKELLKAVWCGKDNNGMAEHWLIPADIDPSVVIKVFEL